MNDVTEGYGDPPKVPTLPVWLNEAATYPAMKAGWDVSNRSPFAFFSAMFLPVFKSVQAESTIAKSMSGFCFAAASSGTGQRKTDRDDDVALLVDHLLHVLGVVGGHRRLHLGLLHAQLRDGVGEGPCRRSR